MILRLEIPEELQGRFLSLFGISLEMYWDTFWGWKYHDDQFERDFPTLTDEQYQLIKELEALEAAQFAEAQKIAEIQFTVFPLLPNMRRDKQEQIKKQRDWFPWEE